MIAKLWYLWPKKGEVWASARRREHWFVHFVYSTVFYLITAIAIFPILLAGISSKGNRTSAESQALNNNADYSVTHNDNGAILTEGNEKIYIGTNCDVVSTKHGEGQWRQLGDQLTIYFSTDSVSIPSAVIGLEGCYEDAENSPEADIEQPLFAEIDEGKAEAVATDGGGKMDSSTQTSVDQRQTTAQNQQSISQFGRSNELVSVQVNHLDRSLDQAYIDGFIRANKGYQNCTPTGAEEFLKEGLFVRLSCQLPD